MKKALSRAGLIKLSKKGEELFRQIDQKNRLPEGEFIAINCDPKSIDFGKFACAPLPSDAADKFEKKFGDDLMWMRQIDWSISPN